MHSFNLYLCNTEDHFWTPSGKKISLIYQLFLISSHEFNRDHADFSQICFCPEIKTSRISHKSPGDLNKVLKCAQICLDYELRYISHQILPKANDLIYAIYIDFTSSVLLLYVLFIFY